MNAVRVALKPDNSCCRRSVHFSTVEVRYYKRILGDNPACSMGPPISIDWEYFKEPVISIDQYEVERNSPKSSIHFALTPSIRRNILQCQWGYTNSEMDKAIEEIEAIQKSRARSTLIMAKKKRKRDIEKLEKAHRRFQRVKKNEAPTFFQACTHAKRKIMRKRAGGSLKLSHLIRKTNKEVSHFALKIMRIR